MTMMKRKTRELRDPGITLLTQEDSTIGRSGHEHHISESASHKRNKHTNKAQDSSLNAESFYLDVPRLFEGDSKASPLRGKRPVSDIEEYLEEHPKVAFLVLRVYSCIDYCDKYKNDFHPIPSPNIEKTVRNQMEGYFFKLPRDGPLATPNSETIDIRSDRLRDAMNLLASSHPEYLKTWDADNDMESPYLQLYHSRLVMENYISNHPEEINDSKEYIKLLYDYAKFKCNDDWSEADRLFQSGVVSRIHLSKLFGPNEIVIKFENGEPMGYICQPQWNEDTHSMKLACWSWGFEEFFHKIKTDLFVNWPEGLDKMEICELDVYPLKYNKECAENRLKIRGAKFWECRHRKFVSYQPSTSSLGADATRMRYMIDTRTYSQMHGGETSEKDELGEIKMHADDPPNDLFILLLPKSIQGFGFHDKKWKMLSVERIYEVDWNENAFDRRLVLKPRKKELIKALINVHMVDSKNTTPDIITGKGKGLIILLHGGPGTGKTLTAESVAELAHKPLYRVTCGDIGTEPEGVEKYLESVLYIGTIWGCVVLLDEADVFLEERTQTDLQRNALVSVFLRVLEYYEGILILTTNRIGMFDEAFKSRIQLAIHYPSLDESGRFEIWDNFLQSLKSEVEDFNYEELKNKLKVLARQKFNGREIRNIINTARQLARYKGERLAYTHFDQAIEVANEFEEYVEKTHGHTNEEWVRAQKIRY